MLHADVSSTYPHNHAILWSKYGQQSYFGLYISLLLFEVVCKNKTFSVGSQCFEVLGDHFFDWFVYEHFIFKV